MMLLDRWMIGAILSVGLVSTVGSAPAQAPSAGGHAAQAPAPDEDDPPPLTDDTKPFQAKRDNAPPDQAPAPAATDQPATEQHPPLQAKRVQAPPDQVKPDRANQAAAAPPATPEERQLQKDTDQLLRLAQELEVEVEKAGSNTLSVAAVRKADEVVKLSKNLKERMKERGQAPQSKVQ
jgi:hypothetical protein